MKRILQVNNHEVLHAEDGATGLRFAKSELPDLILIDLGLPDIDGQTLISVIRAEDGLDNVPVVAVTGWPEATARAMAKAYGFNGYISKPINTRSFPEQIGAFVPQS